MATKKSKSPPAEATEPAAAQPAAAQPAAAEPAPPTPKAKRPSRKAAQASAPTPSGQDEPAPASVAPPEPPDAEAAPDEAPEPSRFIEPLPPLPDAFGTENVVVMARDPETAFIYWEVTAESVARAHASLGHGAPRAALTLRIYSGEGASATSEDHEVKDWLGRFTWHAPRPGVRVAASVGFRADGVFVHLTQSSPARLPRRTPGDAPVKFVRVGPKTLTRPLPAPVPAGGLVLAPGEVRSGVSTQGSAAASHAASAAPGSGHLIQANTRERAP